MYKYLIFGSIYISSTPIIRRILTKHFPLKFPSNTAPYIIKIIQASLLTCLSKLCQASFCDVNIFGQNDLTWTRRSRRTRFGNTRNYWFWRYDNWCCCLFAVYIYLMSNFRFNTQRSYYSSWWATRNLSFREQSNNSKFTL